MARKKQGNKAKKLETARIAQMVKNMTGELKINKNSTGKNERRRKQNTKLENRLMRPK